MTPPSEKLAGSLDALRSLQERGVVAVAAADLPRSHRERLVRHGFLLPVIKGWYVAAAPDRPAGDSTAWYASFWRFCAGYLRTRFGAAWCLSPEQSLLLHAGQSNSAGAASRPGAAGTQPRHAVAARHVAARGPRRDARCRRCRGAGRDARVQTGRRVDRLSGPILPAAPRRRAGGARPRARRGGSVAPAARRRPRHGRRTTGRRLPRHRSGFNRRRDGRRDAGRPTSTSASRLPSRRRPPPGRLTAASLRRFNGCA